MRFAAVINAKAGAARKLGVSQVRDLFTGRLGARLGSIRVVKPKALTTALDEAAGLKPDAILVLGGDGTARSVASHLQPAGIPLAFLPGGTMNILPKRLYGNATLEQILDRLAADKADTLSLPAGRVGREPFFVAAAFGFIPFLAIARENLRAAGSLPLALSAAAQMARTAPRLFNSLVSYSRPTGDRHQSSGLVVSLGDADLLHPWREIETPLDRFECVSLDVKSWWSLAGLSLEILAHPDWRKDPRVEPFETTKLVVSTRRGRIPLTLDGEPVRMRGPLRVVLAKTAFTVLGFRDAAQGLDAAASPVPS